MNDDPAYRLDISGLRDAEAGAGAPDTPRRWIGIRFDCCSAYARIYRNPDGTAYEGRCPRCLRRISIRIGPGGTDARFFRAT